jgi:hypothetical protein
VYGANGRWRPTAWHYCNTVAKCHFTILALVHWPSLNYKRGGWHREWARRNTTGKRDRTTRTTPTDRASAAPIHAKRLGTLPLSWPKLVSPTTSPCGHMEHLPKLDVGNPLGAWTSLTPVSLSPTIRIRRTNHRKKLLFDGVKPRQNLNAELTLGALSRRFLPIRNYIFSQCEGNVGM